MAAMRKLAVQILFTGLFIEFLGEVFDKDAGVSFQIPVYAKVTQNDKQLLSLSSDTNTSRSVWDESDGSQ